MGCFKEWFKKIKKESYNASISEKEVCTTFALYLIAIIFLQKNLATTCKVLQKLVWSSQAVASTRVKENSKFWLWKVFTYIPVHSKHIKNKLSRERHSMPKAESLKLGSEKKKHFMLLLSIEKQSRNYRPKWSVPGRFVREKGKHPPSRYFS